MWHLVKATREGLMGKTTSTGLIIRKSSIFVALPCVLALWKCVEVINPKNMMHATCAVLDVGPWNEYDDEYVFGAAQPAALSGRDARGRKTNGSGIDLSDGLWHRLAMTDNTNVMWRFV
jgi:hypothetical protein